MSLDVAIVGAGCLVPDARGAEALWSNLLAGRDSVTQADPIDWVVDPKLLLDSRRGVPDRTCTLLGGWVGNPDLGLDVALPDGWLRALGRLLSWPVAVSRDALRDAGVADGRDLTGCGLVLGGYPWAASRASQRLFGSLYDRALGLECAPPETMPEGAVELLLAGTVAPAVASALGLGGQRYSIDAACATSLYAIKLASLHLRAGRAELMLAGASTAYDPLFTCLGFSTLQALPEGARSRPLDACSDGLAPAEGCCMFVLKRHADAVRDGDRIHAVVRGVGLSSDGRGEHMLAPRRRGQIVAYERAYAEAGVDPSAVAYVECHATGTRVGDRVEAAGVAEFFGARHELPLLGSVKTNLGHLLTAAGGASLTKVMLALRHGTIPASIGVREPIESEDGPAIGERIVREAQTWPDGPRPRCAAVNAFGFGGTNAHLVLEECGGEPSPPPPLAPAPMAIVGMEAAFGGAHGLDAFARAVHGDRAHDFHSQPPPARTLGSGRLAAVEPACSYLRDFEIDALRYRAPPRELERLSAQHLLLVQVADQALADAGCEPGGRVAVLVALAADPAVARLQARWELEGRHGVAAGSRVGAVKDGLHRSAESNDFMGYIGNLTACRVAALWDFSGPAFAVAAAEHGAQRCLDLAGLMLAAGEADAVVVAAVDLAASPESRLLRGQRTAPLGDGAGAVFVRRLDEARSAGDRVYAAVRAVHVRDARDGEPPCEVMAAGARGALVAAGLGADDVGYVEAGCDEEEAEGLARAYGDNGPAPTCAIGNVRAHVGNTCAAAGMAQVIRATLCVWRRCLPGDGKTLTAPAGGRFYVCADPRPWLRADSTRPRIAAVHGLAGDGSSAHVLLEEPAGSVAQAPAPVQPGSRPLLTVPVIGDSVATVLDGVATLERELAAGAALEAVARRATAAAAAEPDAPLAACLVARSHDGARAEAQLALAAMRDGERWQTPAGSAFTPAPLGRAGSVCFVYPGVNAAFPGVGGELFQLAPGLHDWLERRFASPVDATGERFLHARLPHAPTREDREALEERLIASPAALLRIAALMPVLFTRMLRSGLGITPRSVLGYSFGEVAMIFALGLWDAGDEWLRRLDSAAVVRERLGGPMLAVREHWGLAAGEALEWEAWVVLGAAKDVAAAVDRFPEVYLTSVCAPREVVIAGRAQQCRALMTDAGFDASRAPQGLALHCPPTRGEHGGMAALLTNVVAPSPEVRVHLAAGAVDASDAGSIGEGLATGLCEPADFPALVNRSWAAGDRVFIEVGPGATCSRWIGDILCGREHVAIPASRRGVDESTSSAQLVARLVAERVPLDLGAWAEAMPEGASPTPPPVPVKVSFGAPPIVPLPPPDQIERPAPSAAGARPFVGSPVPSDGAQRALSPSAAEAATAPVLALPVAVRDAVAAAGRASAAHLTMLRTSDDVLHALLDDVAARLGGSDRRRTPSPTAPAVRRPSAPTVLYDEADMLEFAEGRLSRVLGETAAPVDDLPVRVRFPSPPFLAVSRVTRLDAEWGRIGPGAITTEYDVPSSAWNAVDGQCSYLALDAQGLLFLLGAMGVDLENRGRRAFRWLDATITFLGDMPRGGDTVVYDIAITSWVREGDAMLLFADFEATIDGAPIVRIDRCCAGFFTQDELAQAQGITGARPTDGLASRPTRRLPLTCDRRRFDEQALAAVHRGDLAACFGPAHSQAPPNPSLRLPAAPMRMLDRVVSLDPDGGRAGLGTLVAEKDLHPDDWYLRAHFKDDPVFAGPCMLEGSLQALQFLALFGGLHTLTRDARFQPIAGRPLGVRFRGQVPALAGTVAYELDVVERGLEAPEPFVVADVDITAAGRTVGRFEGVGVRLTPERRRR